MQIVRSYQKRKAFLFFVLVVAAIIILLGRTAFLVGFGSSFRKLAFDNEVRQRRVKAKRGLILDRNGQILADNKKVCTVSVIPNQVDNADEVIDILCEYLGLDKEQVEKRVKKHSSIEIIKTNVDEDIGEAVKSCNLAGVKVDIDYKRNYPYPDIMSRVLGFTGRDNQGVVGLESYYDDLLSGENGYIYTYTDARGLEVANMPEEVSKATEGKTLITTLDLNIQKYINTIANETLIQTCSKTVSIVVMNPQNGEILGMTTAPEYNNLSPFTQSDGEEISDMNLLNNMWRIPLISDGFEPGSTFKIITATTALAEQKASLTDRYFCSGCKQVGGRSIHCHKRTGHGSLTFSEAIKYSCNVALMDIGAGVGADLLIEYFYKLGLMEKTGIDMSGEGRSIVHKKEAIGEVELATMSFGQSFQVTPMQHLRAVSCCINGGKLVTPHFLKAVGKDNCSNLEENTVPLKENIVSEEVSSTIRQLLFDVVEDGTGKNARVEGFKIGGKTATSEKLPRGNGKYIASFIGFAPYDNPKVLIFVMIDEPVGVYYGGQIAAPVAGKIFANILPYMEDNDK